MGVRISATGAPGLVEGTANSAWTGFLSELRALDRGRVPRVYMIDAVLGPGRARSEPILDLLIRAQDEGHAVPGFFVYPNPADFDDDMARKFRMRTAA